MEESLRQLWIVCLWYFGISTTITVGLFGWLIKIQGKLTLGESIDANMAKLLKDVEEIKGALKGDYDKKGLITKHFDLDKRVQVLEGRNGNGNGNSIFGNDTKGMD